MELAAVDISVQTSSFAEHQPAPVPMEVESEVLPPQDQENSLKEEQAETLQSVENNDTNPEPDTETVSAEDEDNDNELKVNILKGILKHEHIYGLDKKSVDFDMDIELIPYDHKDYTVEIQIVKELPKRIVSYRELFKKMAEEEKTKGKEDKTADDDDDEDEPENTTSFSHLVLKEPPIHHNTNDIDVNSIKALKAATGQNEKKEDIVNTCQQDAFRREEENNSQTNPDISKVIDKSKFSVTPVNELLEYPSKINLNVSELTEKLIINKDNTLVNGELECRAPLNQITLDDQNKIENRVDHANINSDMETNIIANNRRSRRNKELARHNRLFNGTNEKAMDMITDNDVDDSLFDCGHDYLYSDYNEDIDDDMDLKLDYLTNEKDSRVLNYENTITEPTIAVTLHGDNEKSDIADKSLIAEETRSKNVQKDAHEIGHNNNDNDHENQNHSNTNSKHLNVDINYVNGPIQDKHHQVKLESIKEERSFNLSRENTDLSSKENEHCEMVKIPTLNAKNESDYSSEPNSTSESNSFKLMSETSKNEIITLDDQVNKARGMVDGRVKEEMLKKDVGIQTDFESSYPSHCLLCTCKDHTGLSKANDQEQNVERFQNVTLPSLNSDENIAMLASDVEFYCQEDKSATDSSEGNFRDFTQSTNLDCSSSLSMESFEMDDNSLRIDTVNGVLSSDVST